MWRSAGREWTCIGSIRSECCGFTGESPRFFHTQNRIRADSLDWKDLSASEITSRVTERVQPGSIVLFHNAAKHTPEALPGILEQLLAQGYEFCTISQLLLEGGCTIDVNGMQCPAQSAQ